jgi:CubicO group peptidase (beta-lactamase class C family)
VSGPAAGGPVPAVRPGFGKLALVFERQLEEGLHFGAQIAVFIDGRPVFERWGGHADAARRRPVLSSTPFMAYSATKAFTNTCVQRLAEEGKLDLDAPVAAYWPDFATQGKDGITIRHLLLHEAGIPSEPRLADALAWLTHDGGARRAAAARPLHEPGARCIYHAFSAHFVLGLLIELVTGLGAADYLTATFLEPLGMKDSHAGLPLRLYGSASRIHTGDPAQRAAAAVFSNPVMRSRFLPAASLNTTAHDLATFYAMLASGGEREGRRYLSAETVARATALAYDGPNGDTGNRIRWSAGFNLGGYSVFPDEDIRMMGRPSTEATFGHSGQGGCSIGWADPGSRIAFAFLCNRFLDVKGAHRRFEELSDAAWEGCAAAGP